MFLKSPQLIPLKSTVVLTISLGFDFFSTTKASNFLSAKERASIENEFLFYSLEIFLISRDILQTSFLCEIDFTKV